MKRETEDGKARLVCQDATVAHLDLLGLLGLQDRSSTSQRAMEDLEHLVKQDFRGPWDQKEIKEIQVLQDMHLRDRKENLASSWGQMGTPCTWGAWQDCRVRWAPLALWDLQARMVLMARRERLGFQDDRGGLG